MSRSRERRRYPGEQGAGGRRRGKDGYEIERHEKDETRRGALYGRGGTDVDAAVAGAAGIRPGWKAAFHDDSGGRAAAGAEPAGRTTVVRYVKLGKDSARYIPKDKAYKAPKAPREHIALNKAGPPLGNGFTEGACLRVAARDYGLLIRSHGGFGDLRPVLRIGGVGRTEGIVALALKQGKANKRRGAAPAAGYRALAHYAATDEQHRGARAGRARRRFEAAHDRRGRREAERRCAEYEGVARSERGECGSG